MVLLICSQFQCKTFYFFLEFLCRSILNSLSTYGSVPKRIPRMPCTEEISFYNARQLQDILLFFLLIKGFNDNFSPFLWLQHHLVSLCLTSCEVLWRNSRPATLKSLTVCLPLATSYSSFSIKFWIICEADIYLQTFHFKLCMYFSF